MNAADFDQVRTLLMGTRTIIDGIRACCRLDPDTVPADVALTLTQVQEELGGLIEVVQNRRRMAWESRNPDHPARHIPPIRWPEPTRVPSGADIVRLDMNGRDRDRDPAPLTGKWRTEIPTGPRRRHG